MATSDPIAKVAGGALAGRLREAMEAEFEQRERAIKSEVYHAIRKGQLDPQFAVQKWLEMDAMHRLRSSLVRQEKRVR